MCIEKLPNEIQLQIIFFISSNYEIRMLKQTSRHFYKLINIYHKDRCHRFTSLKMLEEGPEDEALQQSLDNVLKPFQDHTKALRNITQPETPYWEMISSIFLNRRIYFDPKSFIIQTVEGPNHNLNSDTPPPYEFDLNTKAIKIHKCQSFYWEYTTYLPYDTQIYHWCLRLKNHANYKANRVSSGLGTTRFSLKVGNQSISYQYPSSNITEILPDSQMEGSETICSLRLGNFCTVPRKFISNDNILLMNDKEEKEKNYGTMVPVKIMMEETGMFQKRNLEFLSFDIIPIDLNSPYGGWDYMFSYDIVRYDITSDIFVDTISTFVQSLEYQFYQNMERCINNKCGNNLINKIEIEPKTIDNIWNWYYCHGTRRICMRNRADQKEYDIVNDVDYTDQRPEDKSIRLWKLPFHIFH